MKWFSNIYQQFRRLNNLPSLILGKLVQFYSFFSSCFLQKIHNVGVFMNALKTRGVLGGKVLDKWSLHTICSSLSRINPQQRIINDDPPLFFREFDWCASCCGWTQGKDTCSFVADYISFSSKLWSIWFKFTMMLVVRKPVTSQLQIRHAVKVSVTYCIFAICLSY